MKILKLSNIKSIKCMFCLFTFVIMIETCKKIDLYCFLDFDENIRRKEQRKDMLSEKKPDEFLSGIKI